ncbi:MAG: sugar transferase, partial [Candidatus Velthaea sp.]
NEVTGPVFKMKDDPRVFPFGRLLRKLSIDELPNLVNVLLGQMSIVGPRPPLPTEVEGYGEFALRRLRAKPGITCLWQMSGRSGIDFDEWMKLDHAYLDNWSPLYDLKIILATIPAVLFGRGAY